ncbi:hypothetical protein ACLKA7_011774 [Drosophila subpalustris]
MLKMKVSESEFDAKRVHYAPFLAEFLLLWRSKKHSWKQHVCHALSQSKVKDLASYINFDYQSMSPNMPQVDDDNKCPADRCLLTVHCPAHPFLCPPLSSDQ